MQEIMDAAALRTWFERPAEALLNDKTWEAAHAALLDHLERGEVRSAEPDAQGNWRANAWVKAAILLGFRRTQTVPTPDAGGPFFDKPGFPPRRFSSQDGVRVVPGGTSVRRGAHLAKGVVIMPPAYVNVGAWVGEGTMIDSHALVGSCAQIGARVHLSAGAQIGGVLEPANARPVVVEDEAFVGALAGAFEGVVVRRRAVLAAGVVLTASTTIYDLVNGRELRGEIPESAVVVPGSRPAAGPFAKERGLALAAPMIVKYRDAKTDAAVALEEALR
jgi:2,3,4,5-tetrahydropyridine-2,6-dicarboxylate N-succinyltransferase